VKTTSARLWECLQLHDDDTVTPGQLRSLARRLLELAVDLEVDDIAVERTVAGESMPLTLGERRAAVRALSARGLPVSRISARLGIDRRTVVRLRAGASWPRARA
jgi:DNA-binding NarL/FixJ family response regulator